MFIKNLNGKVMLSSDTILTWHRHRLLGWLCCKKKKNFVVLLIQSRIPLSCMIAHALIEGVFGCVDILYAPFKTLQCKEQRLDIAHM